MGGLHGRMERFNACYILFLLEENKLFAGSNMPLKRVDHPVHTQKEVDISIFRFNLLSTTIPRIVPRIIHSDSASILRKRTRGPTQNS